MTTLRWDALSAIDSSQSGLSAEGGSRDKERFNSICSERLLAPHVNRMSRLYSELHRSKALKSRNEGENYVVMAESSLVPRGVETLFFFFHFSFPFYYFNHLKNLLEERNSTSVPLKSHLFDKGKLVLKKRLCLSPLFEISATVVFNATAYCKYGYCKKT